MRMIRSILGVSVGVFLISGIASAIVAAIAKQRSPATVEAGVNVLRSVLGYAEDAGAIKSNPATRLRLAKSRRREMYFLTPEQVRALADAMPYEQYGTLVLFAAYTGMRAGEIHGPRVKRLDLDKRRVDVVERWERWPASCAGARPRPTSGGVFRSRKAWWSRWPSLSRASGPTTRCSLPPVGATSGITTGTSACSSRLWRVPGYRSRFAFTTFA